MKHFKNINIGVVRTNTASSDGQARIGNDGKPMVRLTLAKNAQVDKLVEELNKIERPDGKTVSFVGVRPDGNYTLDLTATQANYLANSLGLTKWALARPFLKNAVYSCTVELREEGDVYIDRASGDEVPYDTTHTVHNDQSITLSGKAQRNLAVAVMIAADEEDDDMLAFAGSAGASVEEFPTLETASPAPKVVEPPVGEDAKSTTKKAKVTS